MKQRISVQAIVRSGDKILLLRRASGHPNDVGKYDVPGGLLDDAESPKDAIARHVLRCTGQELESLELADVQSYVDFDRDVHFVSIIYLATFLTSKVKIKLNQKYDYYEWQIEQKIQQSDLTERTNRTLHLEQHSANNGVEATTASIDVKKTINTSHLIIYSDGGSRGNPGPSASGFVIMNENEQVIHEGGLYLGITTNNQAEYHGVQLGLEKALELGATKIDFRIDSMLVVNQMNGLYTIKNRELWPIHERVQELVKRFEKVSFTHVKRELNHLADGMVNKILNAHARE